MARLSCELLDSTPNLSGLGISPSVLERYGVVEARTNLGRRIAVPYLEDCTKLLAWDGSAIWDGEYVPEAGLFGQRSATTRTLILCAHEFEALRVASVLEANPNLGPFHAVALPTGASLGRLALAVLVDALRVVADRILVWSGTVFTSLSESLEQFVASLDESKVSVKSLALGRSVSPLDLSDAEIVRVLSGTVSTWSPGLLATANEIFTSDGFFETKKGYSTGIGRLDAFIRKLRKSELVMLVAGTGVGKSTLLRQMVYQLAYVENQVCAVAFLEETRKETLLKFACIHHGLSNTELLEDPNALGPIEWKAFLNLPGTANLKFIAQDDASGGFGGLDVETLLGTARYLKRRAGIDFLAIDHLSIMVSGKESSKEGERKDIDIMMTKLAIGCVMLEIGILGVCHLSNPEGRPHEEGGRVLLQHMRGSGSLKQLSWCVIAQERNQQGSDNRTVLVRVLKNRNGGGRTGPAAVLEFRDPTLIERTDIDPNELADEMAGTRKKSGRPAPDTSSRSNPFTDKPGRRIGFGKLEDKVDGD